MEQINELYLQFLIDANTETSSDGILKIKSEIDTTSIWDTISKIGTEDDFIIFPSYFNLKRFEEKFDWHYNNLSYSEGCYFDKNNEYRYIFILNYFGYTKSDQAFISNTVLSLKYKQVIVFDNV